MNLYQRIACLSTEAVEVLYALGAQDLVVGISGYTVYPPQARTEKTKISGFSSAKLERILAVKPDLVLTYSNMQAELARELIAAGIEVHAYSQRDVAGILRMIACIAALVGKVEQGQALIARLQTQIDAVKAHSLVSERKPKIYFEEWDSPLMTGIGWVVELIEFAGGQYCFPEHKNAYQGRERIIEDPIEVIQRAPDIIIGSWCGKKFRSEQVATRPGWAHIPAVRQGRIYEIKSPDILSPGPAAIEHGLLQIQAMIADWQAHSD